MNASVEEQIRKAIEAGQFDNLPGKGKPLHWEDNPHEDPEWRLAYQALKNAGYSLPWIEKRREIEADLGEARAALQRAWAWRQAARGQGEGQPMIEVEWRRVQECFRSNVESINRRIAAYNLEAPLESFQRPLVKPEVEILGLEKSDHEGG
jgi:DnaJ family protein C protein 28